MKKQSKGKQAKKEVKKQVKKETKKEQIKKQTKKQTKAPEKSIKHQEKSIKHQEKKQDKPPKIQWTQVKLASAVEAIQSDHLYIIRDLTGNLPVFFRYKGNLLQVNNKRLSASLGGSMQQIQQGFRKQVLNGFSGQDSNLLDLGDNPQECMQFLQKMKWFSSKDLLKPVKKIPQQIFNKLVVKQSDTNLFGNKGFYICQNSKLSLCSSSSREQLQKLADHLESFKLLEIQ